MREVLVFIVVYLSMICMSLWESSVEGRKAWDKGKYGWKIKYGEYVIMTRYHLSISIMLVLLFSLPLIVNGWNTDLFGVLLSALFSGLIVEDFFWYVLNPKVRFREWHSSFSNYYPWIKISNKKIIPASYIIAIFVAFLSWYFLWR